MEEREKEELGHELSKYGFPQQLLEQIDLGRISKDQLITLKQRREFGDDVVNYTIYVGFNKLSGSYELQKFDASLRKDLAIPQRTVHGIRIPELDQRMGEMDWQSDAGHLSRRKNHLLEILEDLNQNEHPTALEAREKLILKHLADSPASADFTNMDKLRAKFEIQRTFDNNLPIQFTAQQAYNLLAGRAVGVELKESPEAGTRWFQADELAVDFTGMPVIRRLGGSESYDLYGLLELRPLTELTGEQSKNDLLESLKSGNPAIATTIEYGIEQRVVLVADPRNNRILIDAKEMVRLGMLPANYMDGPILKQSAVNEEKIEEILSELERLGFGKENEYTIRRMIYFGESFSTIQQQKELGNDIVNYHISIGLDPELEKYQLSKIDASLQKGYDLADGAVAGLSLADLKNELDAVDWKTEDYFSKAERDLRLLDVVASPDQRKVDELICQLELLAASGKQGAMAAELLQLKYLAGTPNEGYIADPQALKNKYEFNYSFEMEAGFYVNASEIYHLLDGRAVARSLYGLAGENTATPGYISLMEDSDSSSLIWFEGCSNREISDFLDMLEAKESDDPHELNKVLKTLAGGEDSVITILLNEQPTKRAIHIDAANRDIICHQHVNHPVPIKCDAVSNLVHDLQLLGFGGSDKYVLRGIANNSAFSEIRNSRSYEHDNLNYVLRLTNISGEWEPNSLDATLFKEIKVPALTIAGISTARLENSMLQIDWNKRDYWQMGDPVWPIAKDGVDLQTKASLIFQDLDKLLSIPNKEGQWAAEALMMKYLRNTPNEYSIVELDKLKAQYEITFRFGWNDFKDLDLNNVYNLMDGRFVLAGQGLSGQEVWNRINFTGLQDGKPPYLEKVEADDGFGIWEHLDVLAINNPSTEDITDEAINGNRFVLDVNFNHDSHSLKVYADPINNQIRYFPLLPAPALEKYLSGQEGWQYEKPINREIGQNRDYTLHPLAIDEKLYEDLTQDIRLAGFGESHDQELREKIQIGYPEFTITHQENLDDQLVRAELSFTRPKQDLVIFESFFLNTRAVENKGDISLRIEFTNPYFDLPQFSFREAGNLLLGRHVARTNNVADNREHWYRMDFQPAFEDGRFPVHEYDSSFNLEYELSRYPVKEMEDTYARAELVKALKQGDKVPVRYTVNDKEEIRLITADMKNVAIIFHEKGIAGSRGIDQPEKEETNRVRGAKR